MQRTKCLTTHHFTHSFYQSQSPRITWIFLSKLVLWELYNTKYFNVKKKKKQNCLTVTGRLNHLKPLKQADIPSFLCCQWWLYSALELHNFRISVIHKVLQQWSTRSAVMMTVHAIYDITTDYPGHHSPSHHWRSASSKAPKYPIIHEIHKAAKPRIRATYLSPLTISHRQPTAF